MAEQRLAETTTTLEAIQSSLSWRITSIFRTPPIHFLYRQIICIREQGLIGRIRFVSGNLSRMGAVKAFRFIEGHPFLYQWSLKIIQRFGFYDKALSIYRACMPGNQQTYAQTPAQQPVGVELLSPRAQRIYLQLKEAIEKRQSTDVK